MAEAEIKASLDLPTAAWGLAHDGEALWVALDTGHALRLDPASGEALSETPLPGQGPAAGLAWTAPRETAGEAAALWVARPEAGVVLEVDPASGEERRSLEVAGEDGRLGGLCTDGAAGPTLWFVETVREGEDAGSRAGRFDVRDGEVHKRIVVAGDATGLAWGGRWLWHGRRQARRLQRIDPMFADVTASLELDFPPLGVTFAQGELWAVDEETPRLVRLAAGDAGAGGRSSP